MLKRLLRSKRFQRFLGRMIGRYIRLVHATSRWQIEPADFYERVDRQWPVILAMWHGQHFMVTVFKRPNDKIRALISRHRDGEINAQVVEYFGAGAVRGSGFTRDAGAGRQDKILRKGGSRAHRAMVSELEDGATIVETADVPKISRIAGRGIVMLARDSGRPIIPIAIATSRRIDVNSWDRSSINLPFSKGALVAGEPIMVPPETSRDGLEDYRKRVEDTLNEVSRRALEIVDGGNNDG